MDTIHQIGQHRAVPPRDVTVGDAGCKILPFRQARSPEPLEDDEVIRESLSREFAEEYPFAESGRYQVACLAEYPDADPCQAVYPSRWLKRVLLASAFTAWTVAAIAMSIALG
jgi:hypothetical protein